MTHSPSTPRSAVAPPPDLSAVVVHWRNEAELERLLDVWPNDPRFELVVVDNSTSLPPLPAWVIRIDPDTNLGFGGGVNRGVTAARAPWILMLNPDARPREGALDALLETIDRLPHAAGIVPALEGADGTHQCRWQLRPLPSPWALVLQTLRFAGIHGPHDEPPPGTPIAQPAAAALAIRRSVFDGIGGFDPQFFPAWFEDVDLAKRLAAAGHRLHYAPNARFVHELGASVPHVGYGRFLWIYYRHLTRYLGRHHGPAWRLVGHLGVALGMSLRAAALPVRRSSQAPNRRIAAAGLLATAVGALTGWRFPKTWCRAYRDPSATETTA